MKGIKKMKTVIKRIAALAIVAMMLFAVSAPAFAAEAADTQTEQTADGASADTVIEAAQEQGAIGSKAIAAGICVGIAAAGGGIGMGLTTAKSTESIARQPEASGDIRTTMMLGFVFIETAIIYALIIGILVIFVL